MGFIGFNTLVWRLRYTNGIGRERIRTEKRLTRMICILPQNDHCHAALEKLGTHGTDESWIVMTIWTKLKRNSERSGSPVGGDAEWHTQWQSCTMVAHVLYMT